jgi:hypothetical protein
MNKLWVELRKKLIIITKLIIIKNIRPHIPFKISGCLGIICRLHFQAARIRKTRNKHERSWEANFLTCLILQPWGWGEILFRNISWLSQDYTPLLLRGLFSLISFASASRIVTASITFYLNWNCLEVLGLLWKNSWCVGFQKNKHLVCVCVYIYVYIYIYRERERESHVHESDYGVFYFMVDIFTS